MLILDLLTLIQIVEHFKPSSYGQDSRRVNNGFLKLRAFQLTHCVKILQTSWVGVFWAKTESKLLTLLIISGHAQLSRQLWVLWFTEIVSKTIVFQVPISEHLLWQREATYRKAVLRVGPLLWETWLHGPGTSVLLLGAGRCGDFCLLVLKEFDVRVLVAVQETVGMKFQISWRDHCISLKRRPMDTHPWPKKIHFACFQWYQLKFEFSLFLSFFLPRHLALSPFFPFFFFLRWLSETAQDQLAWLLITLYIISTTQQLICKRPVCGFSKVGGWVLILHEKILFSLFFTFS